MPAPHDPETARAKLLRSESDSLAQADRRYIHLVDGGVSDNLGLRRIADYVAQTGGIRSVLALLQDVGLGAEVVPWTIVFLSVNSERPASPEIERSAEVPGTLAVLNALLDGNLGRQSRETSLVFSEAVAQWREELRAARADADIFLVDIKLADLADRELRQDVLAIPTAFRISTRNRELLRHAAQAGMAESAEFRRLVLTLGLVPQTSP